MGNYQDRLLNVIPGGAHTYSRGYDQYPSNAPQILKRGYGAYVFDDSNSKFLDYGMGLRSVILGYANEEVNKLAIEQINFGNNLTRPSMIELEAAELFVSMFDSVDMVKFTKNGSSAVSAAVKLARAYTGRKLIARCAEQPFFSYDDWFIGSTPVSRGIPEETINATKLFNYNNIQSLIDLISKHPNQFACVVMEPASTECPFLPGSKNECCGEEKCIRNYKSFDNNYLQEVQELCKKNGIVFILDEMITGFRWDMKGAQHFYNIKPDLSTFGKAMANGFSLGCVAGKREIMSLGSIEEEGRERVFLLSTTHGSEMSSLGAYVATMNFMSKHDVIQHIWSYGKRLMEIFKYFAEKHDISNSFLIKGIPCSPWFATLDLSGKNSLKLRTLFMQEMIKNKVLMPWIALSYSHTTEELNLTAKAIDCSFEIYRKALHEGVEKYLVGDPVKPVFRKYN